MTEARRDHDTSALTTSLQQVRNSLRIGTIPSEQQRAVMDLISEILQACARGTYVPLPGNDMREVRGQNAVKRALEIAAAGAHNILLVGSHGSGKTLLARTFPSLLPESGVPYPFRAPHFSIDKKTFIGAASSFSPGELTLAHEGVLFLESLSAFKLPLLLALRQAVEQHVVVLTQREKLIHFPAHFILIATTALCPCGFYGIPERCTCSPETITRFQQRIRDTVDACFDIQIEVKPVGEEIYSTFPEEDSASIRQRVEKARKMQQHRLTEKNFRVNADLRNIDDIQHYCVMDRSAKIVLREAQQYLHLSAHQILHIQKVARTIADLAGSQILQAHHIAESLQYQLIPRL